MKTPVPFDSLPEIREYLSGNSVECLICGKRLLRLNYKHLSTHGISQDAYREQFGIPWTYSLTSAVSRANSARSNKPINLANLTHRRVAGDGTEGHRKAPPAARKYWRDTIRPQGPMHNAQVHIIEPCIDCGAPVETTKLTRVHGTRCVACRPRAKELRDLAKAKLRTAQTSSRPEGEQLATAPLPVS